VIIETKMEAQCKEVDQVEYEEECDTKLEEQCDTTQDYVCEEAPVVAPADDYGVPQVGWLDDVCKMCLEKWADFCILRA